MGELTIQQAAARLGVKTDQVKGAIANGHLPEPLTRELVRRLEDEPPTWLLRARKAKRGRQMRRQTLAEKREERKRRDGRAKERVDRVSEERIAVTVPSRRREPETVRAHLGPTNSGKTHAALEFLRERGRGVYAAPLRMLAQEGHARLLEELGERVGLVTGEERVNERAPVICCTVEMAPMSGDTLVLDEVHWAEDRERGSAWTRLLAGGEYRHIRLLGALDALPLVKSAFPDVEVSVHERLGPLEWEGARRLADLEPATVVVAFSRKAVLALAAEVHRRGMEVAALYGAMPPGARRAEIARFVAGEARVCVATDVIGHGLNLPCRTILFAETTKFDGVSRRALDPWEVAQIAGRAGRYGLHELGHVGVLTGLPWLSPEPRLVESALEPHLDLGQGLYGYRQVTRGRLRPRLDDLSVGTAYDLERVLPLWSRVATRRFAKEGWLAIEPVGPLLGSLALLRESPGALLSRLSLEEVWTLLNAPIDAEVDAGLLLLFGSVLGGSRRARAHLRHLVDLRHVEQADLKEAEAISRRAAAFRWFALTYPGHIDVQEAAALEEAAARRVAEQVRLEVTRGAHGRCASCGKPAAPWFELCDSCFRQSRADWSAW